VGGACAFVQQCLDGLLDAPPSGASRTVDDYRVIPWQPSLGERALGRNTLKRAYYGERVQRGAHDVFPHLATPSVFSLRRTICAGPWTTTLHRAIDAPLATAGDEIRRRGWPTNYSPLDAAALAAAAFFEAALRPAVLRAPALTFFAVAFLAVGRRVLAALSVAADLP
jgi:hypothetical protein